MSKDRSSGWFGPLIWLALFPILAILLYFAVTDEGDTCPSGRIPWDCLTWGPSIDRYERQFRDDLPSGTARRDVKDYLERERIAVAPSVAARTSGREPILIERRWPVWWQPKLDIRILFDADDRVEEIDFRRSSVAP